MHKTLAPLALALLLAGCATTALPPEPPPVAPTPTQLQAAARVGLAEPELTALLNKPLYRMQPAEVGRFLAWQQLDQPQLRQRVAALARKNIGQPYELYLLGEFPYETYDRQPLFDLAKSDCVVFGMPRAAIEIDAQCAVERLDDVARAMMNRLRKRAVAAAG